MGDTRPPDPRRSLPQGRSRRHLDHAARRDLRGTGSRPRELLAGLGALESADPPYLDVAYGGGWSDERAGGGYVSEVSERARRELGAWPTADGLLEQLVAALIREAEEEPEPERRGRLRNAADVLGGAARDIAVSVISARLGRIG